MEITNIQQKQSPDDNCDYYATVMNEQDHCFQVGFDFHQLEDEISDNLKPARYKEFDIGDYEVVEHGMLKGASTDAAQPEEVISAYFNIPAVVPHAPAWTVDQREFVEAFESVVKDLIRRLVCQK